MLTVMTYNVANGLARPDELLRLIRQSDADLVALQELAPLQAEAIDRQLRDRYPFQRLHPLGIPGKGLLSAHPIVADELLSLFPGRPDLSATVRIGEDTVRIVVAHPPPPRIKRSGIGHEPETRRQLAALIEVATDGDPTILLGDFNLVNWHAGYRQLRRAGLIDAFAHAGRGAGETLPTRLARWAETRHPLGQLSLRPFLRVDYVWLTHQLNPLSAWVGHHAGSDHLPVLATIAFSAPPRG